LSCSSAFCRKSVVIAGCRRDALVWCHVNWSCFCDRPIPRPEESYWVCVSWSVIRCNRNRLHVQGVGTGGQTETEIKKERKDEWMNEGRKEGKRERLKEIKEDRKKKIKIEWKNEINKCRMNK